MSTKSTLTPLGRREVLAAIGGAATLATVGCTSNARPDSPAEPSATPSREPVTEHQRMPSIFLPHGGGPWPWTPPFTPALGEDYASLRAYLESIPDSLPQRPEGIVIVSAHWEAPLPTVMSRAVPRMLYDYAGFPEDTYSITWPASGSPTLARRVHELLGDSGIDTAENGDRGFDHGTFVPLKLAFPQADIPTVQLSLDAGYDPERHIAMGRALAPLRDEGILIIGSGMSWEDFRAPNIMQRSGAFDMWFQQTATADAAARDQALRDWTRAPYARSAHPHEEHLLPMMVAAGAAGQDIGHIAWEGSLLGIRLSAVHFGAA